MADSRLQPQEAPTARATAVEGAVLKVRPDGPNMLTGDVMLAGARSAPAGRTTLVLCRCGASRNKPYCDGTHTRNGFRDPGTLPADPPAGMRGAGRVTVTPTPNGPLECIGPLAVEGADGRLLRGDAAAAAAICKRSRSRRLARESDSKASVAARTAWRRRRRARASSAPGATPKRIVRRVRRGRIRTTHAPQRRPPRSTPVA
jgi:CDGSH-type Zn-finger protein